MFISDFIKFRRLVQDLMGRGRGGCTRTFCRKSVFPCRTRSPEKSLRCLLSFKYFNLYDKVIKNYTVIIYKLLRRFCA